MINKFEFNLAMNHNFQIFDKIQKNFPCFELFFVFCFEALKKSWASPKLLQKNVLTIE